MLANTGHTDVLEYFSGPESPDHGPTVKEGPVAHEVKNMSYVNNGSLARTGVPWHGLGVSFDDWMTDEQALSTIDWEVHTEPQYRRTKAGIYEPVAKSNAVVRTDTDEVLGSVGDLYTPYQNRELIELGSILVDDWGAKWDTVMSLRDDKLVVATLRLDVVGGEGRGLAELGDSEYYSWLVLANGHDGNHSLLGQVVSTRVVCANTFQMAKAGGKPGWSVRHTGDITSKAREAQRTIGLVTQHQKDFEELALKLAAERIVEEEFDKLTAELFPVASGATDRAKAAAEGRQAAAKSNWLHSTTIPESIRETKWGALNGITEYVEHIAEHKGDKRVNLAERRVLSNVFGGPDQKIRQRAISLLV